MRIKALTYDNGCEYSSLKFTQFLDKESILHQLITPYGPQQNRVSERKNRTILDMCKCLMLEKNMPKRFWAEVTFTIVYLLNVISTKARKNITPYEAWHGNMPSIDHLEVFGSLCYHHT